MAVTLTNSFAGGTNGTGITAGNSGGASGDAFDYTSYSSATGEYSNAPVHLSALSGAFAASASGQNANVTWGPSLTASTLPQAWIRMYSYLSSVSGFLLAAAWVNAGSNNCGSIAYDGTTLQLRDSGNTVQAASALTLPAGQWFRVEGYLIGSASAGQIQVKTFLSPDSATPDETLTTGAAINTSGAIKTVQYGVVYNFGSAVTHYAEWLGASDTAYLGPVASASPSGLLVAAGIA